MQRKNKTTGVLLLIVGLVWLLMRLDIISFSWWAMLRWAWPLALIGFGLSIIFADNAYMKWIVWGLIGCIFLGYGIYYEQGYSIHNNQQSSQEYDELIPLEDGLEKGLLQLELGGCQLILEEADGTTAFMKINSSIDDLKQTSNMGNTQGEIRLWRTERGLSSGDLKGAYLNLFLNPSLNWTVQAGLGAVEGAFDFSNLKLDKLDLDIGAGDLDIIFAKPEEETQFDLDGGVAKLTLYLPDDVGIQIDYEGALNKTNFGEFGLVKVNDYYQSPQYDQAEQVINMEIDMGVGIIELKQVRADKVY